MTEELHEQTQAPGQGTGGDHPGSGRQRLASRQAERLLPPVLPLRTAPEESAHHAVESQVRAEPADVAETSALLARGNHAMIYGTTISLHVAIADPDTDLGATIDEVTDELAQIDQRTPELLDYAVSSDATDNSVVFEVTVDADDDMEALAAAASWVRAAIHATGGYTPDWITGGVEGTVERIATHA